MVNKYHFNRKELIHDIEISIGCEKDSRLITDMLNNIEIKNKKIIQSELYFMNRIVWANCDKTKRECVEDIKNVDFDLLNFMFENSVFNGDISKWNVCNVYNMKNIFKNSKFDGDISNWKLNKKIYGMKKKLVDGKWKIINIHKVGKYS